MVREVLTRCLVDILKCSVSEAEQEVTTWMSGEAQRSHRNTVLRKKTVIDFWGECHLPRLRELFTMLLHCPCASASVERLFSIHARIHHKLRSSAKEEAVLQQMMLHSFLKANDAPHRNFDVQDLTHSELTPIIDQATQAFRATKAEALEPGQRVKVFYENEAQSRTRRGAKPLEFECKLVDLNEEEEGRLSWNVSWRLARTSTDPFYPLEDSWILL